MSRARVLCVVILALLTAGAIAGCGSSRSAGSSGVQTLSVRPSPAQTTSEIRFGFSAPVAAGTTSSGTTNYSLSVTGPAGRGCVGAHEAASPSVAKGAAATITVGPAQLGKPWCAGYYTARVLELHRAPCKAGAVCSQAIAVVGTVAKAGFTIKKG